MTAETLTDDQLLARLRTGDETAFSAIYKKYWVSLYESAYRRLHNSEQVEDLLQDVFVNLWTRRNELAVKDLPAYLHTAIKYKVLNYVERDLASGRFYEAFEAITINPGRADSGLMEKELLDLIILYIESLPEKRRNIFLLHLKGNLNTEQIAALLEVSRKTVQNQLNTAIKGLQNYLGAALMIFVAGKL